MLTIITINYNNDLGLQRTLTSLRNQVNNDLFELVIIDGASTDNSVKIIEDFSVIFDNMICISEKDHGIYDAMNKGIDLSSGEYLAFLNSGDVLASNNIINQLFHALQMYNPDVLYSDLWLIKPEGKIYRKWSAGRYQLYKLYLGWMPPHPMTIVKTELFQTFGKFDLKFKIAADYHFLLRALLTPNTKVYYLRLCSVLMEMGGASNSGFKSVGSANLEIIKAWYDVKGWKIPFWVIILKPLMKLAQLRYGNLTKFKGKV